MSVENLNYKQMNYMFAMYRNTYIIGSPGMRRGDGCENRPLYYTSIFKAKNIGNIATIARSEDIGQVGP